MSKNLASQPRKDIHLVKARQAQPFVQYLNSQRAPVVFLAAKAGLDLEAVSSGEGVIAERPIWRFVDIAARRMNRPHLGYEAARCNHVDLNGILAGFKLPHGESLRGLLKLFFKEFRGENSGADYALRPEQESAWITRRRIFSAKESSWQMEQYFFECLFQIVRVCTGPGWLPPRIRVHSRKRPVALPPHWAGVEVEWGCAHSEIFLPEEVLAMPPVLNVVPGTGAESAQLLNSEHFPRHLEYLIASGQPKLERAADDLGISSATLKRRLRERGTTFSQELESCRFRMAQELLRENQLSLREISAKLGYEHQASFSRSFRRMAGVSPLQFRHQPGGGSNRYQ